MEILVAKVKAVECLKRELGKLGSWTVMSGNIKEEKLKKNQRLCPV